MSIPYIDQNEFIRALNAGILYLGGGTAGKYVVERILYGNKRSFSSLFKNPSNIGFFQPFRSREDLLKIYSPITAPVTFAILAAEMFIGFAVNALKCVLSALTFNGSEFKQGATDTAKCFANTVALCFAAVISPIVNLIDVVGSVLNTAREELDCCTERSSFSI